MQSLRPYLILPQLGQNLHFNGVSGRVLCMLEFESRQLTHVNSGRGLAVCSLSCRGYVWGDALRGPCCRLFPGLPNKVL